MNMTSDSCENDMFTYCNTTFINFNYFQNKRKRLTRKSNELHSVTLWEWPIVQNTGGTSKHYTSQQQGFIKQQQAQATRNSGTKLQLHIKFSLLYTLPASLFIVKVIIT